MATLPEVHLRYPAQQDHAGTVRLPWLDAIHEANRLTEDAPMFEAPMSTGPWWAGGSVEEYPDARVLHRDDGSVSILPKTDRGADVLRKVGEAVR